MKADILKSVSLLVIVSGLLFSCQSPSPPEVNTVTIGTQEWCVENLDVETFRNGDPIPHAQTSAEWELAGINKEPAWCYYNNDTALGQIYGKLYNWYAVNDPRGLAPEGFHIPSNAEWSTLGTFLGNSGAGGKLKSIGTEFWLSPNTNATNEAGFTALPGGFRAFNSPNFSFFLIGEQGLWWSATELDSTNALIRLLLYDSDELFSSSASKGTGISVRCIKD